MTTSSWWRACVRRTIYEASTATLPPRACSRSGLKRRNAALGSYLKQLVPVSNPFAKSGMPMRPLRILGFAGSLRQRAASELAPEDMLIAIFDLLQIPLYNADVEARGDPEPVAAFKQAIRQADAVLMVTPEYNHGVPGVMKNAVDWASRPPQK